MASNTHAAHCAFVIILSYCTQLAIKFSKVGSYAIFVHVWPCYNELRRSSYFSGAIFNQATEVQIPPWCSGSLFLAGVCNQLAA